MPKMSDATLARLIRPTPAYCELIFQLAHYQRGVGAAEAEAVRHNSGQFAIGRFGHDVQTRSLLVQLFNVDARAIKPCSSISRE